MVFLNQIIFSDDIKNFRKTGAEKLFFPFNGVLNQPLHGISVA